MVCKLCLREAGLVESHIIPEFFYKPLYDELHRFYALSIDEDEKNRIVQKGLRETLLCDRCEELISPWEKYVSEVFYGGVEIGIERGKGYWLISNIDYDKFRLFQLSLLWRASVSSLPAFKAVKLGPHEERIRSMLLTKRPGEYCEYGVFVAVPMLQEGGFLKDLIVSPDAARVEGHRVYRFVLGGCSWAFFVSSHSETLRFSHLFLKRDGRLLVSLMRFEDMAMLFEMATKMNESGRVQEAMEYMGRKKEHP